jgi:hypothetical protein
VHQKIATTPQYLTYQVLTLRCYLTPQNTVYMQKTDENLLITATRLIFLASHTKLTYICPCKK